jgi:hypothetical protein
LVHVSSRIKARIAVLGLSTKYKGLGCWRLGAWAGAADYQRPGVQAGVEIVLIQQPAVRQETVDCRQVEAQVGKRIKSQECPCLAGFCILIKKYRYVKTQKQQIAFSTHVIDLAY